MFLPQSKSGERLFPSGFLDELRARVPVSEIVGKHVKLRRAGREWTGLSPFNVERTPSFTINDQKGFYHCFSSGKHGDVFAFLVETEGVEFRDAVERVAAIAGIPVPVPMHTGSAPVPAIEPPADRNAAAEAERATRRRQARAIWEASVDIGGTLAATYLAGRKLVLPEGMSGRVLRFCPRTPWTTDDGTLVYVPALISLCRDIHNDRPSAILRRALTADGKKLGKPRSLGAMAGTAVKLTDDTDIEQGLIIAEGVETALAAMMMDLKPCWAVGGPGMRSFPVLAGVDCLGIVVDNDVNSAGQGAAAAAYDRWTEAGREVICHVPNVTGQDMNDVVLADE